MRAALLALALVACASANLAPRDCTPSATNVCACPGGAAGVQTCAPDGTLGACLCADAGGADGGAGDAAPQEDRAPAVDVVAVRDAGGLEAVDVVTPEDRPPAPTDTVAGPHVVDVVSGPDVADAGVPPDARVNCGLIEEPRCSSHADCERICLPTPSGFPYCCSAGGACLAHLSSLSCPRR